MQSSLGPVVGHRWQLIGGHLALDLVNTVSWQLNRERITDQLRDPAHLADWLAVVAVLHGAQVTVTSDDLSGAAGDDALLAVRRLRDAGTALLAAHLARQPLQAQAVQVVRDGYYQALAVAEVAPGLPLRHHVVVHGPGQIVDLLGLALGDLVCADRLERLRRCDDEDCGWFFLDTSRSRSRRWCDPGDCGNRNRVRAFAAKARA